MKGLRSRWVWACVLLILALVAPSPANAQSLSASNFAFSASDTHTGESMGTSQTPSSDGYVGTFSYDFSVGRSSVTYKVCFTVSYYDATTDTWEVYDQNYVTVSGSAGSSGTVLLDFYADLSTGIPDGAYQLSAWVCTGTSSDVTAVLGGATGSDSLVFSTSVDDPLPMPEPHPGPDPGTGTPIITGPLPPSGPIGPGTSIVLPNQPNGGQ